jgi:NAD(P)-dependent dehydrogenase (short-subunit alcohol dehydrogenase family)
MKRLENRWALVTGSSRGIGQQVAVGLAQHGCNVIVHGRSLQHTVQTVHLLEEQGAQAFAVEGDLASEAGVRTVIEGVRSGPGQVDILYNNAGIQNRWNNVWEISLDEWRLTFQVNLFAMVALCNAFVPHMVKRNYGRVVNVTSGIVDTPQLAPYSVSKAAVDKYTRDLAAELRGTHVLVNMLDPGWLKTDMGGPNAQHSVETVLPGALVPVLFENDGPNGQFIAAQDYRE